MRIFAFFLPFFLILLLRYSVIAQWPLGNLTTAHLSTTWTNNEFGFNAVYFSDDSIIIPILFREFNYEPRFICGFFRCGNCTSFHFAIILGYNHSIPPEVVWSANRDYPVRDGAILNLTAAGELVLQDFDGSTAWTTNTSGKSVVGMNLTATGNLVLFDVHDSVVWQSFDHPTDSLLLGQKLFEGQKLIPTVSSTDLTAQKGLYSLQVTYNGLFAYVGSNPPQPYRSFIVYPDQYTRSKKTSYVRFLNGGLSMVFLSAEPSDPHMLIHIPEASSVQYMKLMPDGHLKVFEFQGQGRIEVADLLTGPLGECSYPLACGRNALCVAGNQCSCPRSISTRIDYFRPVNDLQPNRGCSEITHLTCNATQEQDFIELENVDHSAFTRDLQGISMEACKQVCMSNCSCKAVIFRHGANPSSGYCYLPSEIYTLMKIDFDRLHDYSVSTFLKVPNTRPSTSSTSQTPGPLPKRKNRVATVVGSTIGSIVLLLVVIVGCIMFVIHKRKKNDEMEERYLDQVPGLLTRFTYEELKTATENFSKKLGQGGFGSVFEGTLEDGSKIAVKRLEGVVQVNKSFLAEVESIGSIHHVNLVRLRGFCALKSLLVYEFMSNGSLDRWIYRGDQAHVLNWECRKKIVVDIAKGLAYLHEDCRQKIIHLDIKPQNILLDNDFNAKIADFGLSKLVDRDQTQVMTTMRGTPGYLAPEWLSSVITEKVDVYSFGIVLLEILCGRKNFDRSQPEESWHLLRVFQNGCEQEKLLDIVDKYSEDMQAHGGEVVEMMKVVSWCLQTDFTRRPSMSSVVKVLEGVMNVESNLDYNFTDPRLQKTRVGHEIDLTQPLPSFLSGPR